VTSSKTAFQNPDVRFININTCNMDAHKMNALSLVGDARATLEALQELVLAEGTVRDITAYHSEIEALQNEWRGIVDDLRAVDDSKPITQAQVIGLVNDAAGPKDVVINAAGSMPGDLLKLWRAEDPKSYHIEYGYSCMGCEIPAGLGVKMADPDREVFVFIGDGSYLMLNAEIVTAVQEGVKIVIVLVDNGGFQSIHGLQMGSGSPSFGNELRFRNPDSGTLDGSYVPVDFARTAEGLGARSFTASNAEELRQALEQAKAEPHTVLIQVNVDPEARVPNYEGWWDVPIAEVSSEASVNEVRAQYEQDIKRQRWFG